MRGAWPAVPGRLLGTSSIRRGAVAGQPRSAVPPSRPVPKTRRGTCVNLRRARAQATLLAAAGNTFFLFARLLLVGGQVRLIVEVGARATWERRVRVPSRPMSPPWRSIRFRLALRTYDAPPMWALSTCGEPDEIKKNTHPKKIPALFREQLQPEGVGPAAAAEVALPELETAGGVDGSVRYAPTAAALGTRAHAHTRARAHAHTRTRAHGERAALVESVALPC